MSNKKQIDNCDAEMATFIENYPSDDDLLPTSEQSELLEKLWSWKEESEANLANYVLGDTFDKE